MTAPNDAPRAATGTSFELSDILDILRDRIGLIVRVTALVVAIAVVAALMMPVRYSSSSVVMLDPRKNVVADLSAVLSALPTDPASLQNQIQIITSRDLAAEVIGKLKLYDDPEFNGALSQSLGSELLSSLNPKRWFSDEPLVPSDMAVQRDAVIDSFLGHLSAEALGLSTTITIAFSSKDPAKAARIADAVAQTYVENLVETKLKASEATSGWLTQRIRELANQVQAQEAAALRYRAQHHLDSSTAGTALIEQQLGGINGQIVLARADLSAKSAVYNQVQRLVQEGHPADISQVIASPLIIQLRTQQADLLKQSAALAVPYGPKHPKRIAIESQLKDLDMKIGEEAARVASALANDVAVARAQLNSLQGSLSHTQNQASGQDLTAVHLRALEAEADSTRKLYESFLNRLRAIQDQDGLATSDAHVISTAAIPSAPSTPPRMLLVLASIPAGLLLGCLVALLTFRFSLPRQRREPAPMRAPRVATVRSAPHQPAPSAQIAQRTPPPLLAEVPGALAAGAADLVIDWPGSSFSRAVHALLGRVVPQRGAPPRVVSVTTSEAGEVGSTVALALARAASRNGLRTVLVDGHVAQPLFIRQLGLRPQAGMMEALSGKVPFAGALVRDPRSKVLLLGALQPPRDPRAVMTSPRLTEMFTYLRSIADFIVVAVPPVPTVGETPYFARLSDSVVMVARPEEAPRPALNQSLSTLGEWRAPPVGMVLVR
ncbi:MAG: hypothetical protein JO348_11925 [Alphaproteobacteria bacterium]|nr:hypothetical protein [Alphaproteobacteria bacterium]MBV9420471.1 hypothetical protein [Alphaproteobacteria bacterium]